MTVLALDLGGSHIGCGIVEGGRVLAVSTINGAARSRANVLSQLKAALLETCQSAGVRSESCSGIGVGFPGVVDGQSGEILSTLGNKFDDLNSEDLRAWCEREFGLPMRIENDARLALLGEHFAGAAKGFEDVVMVTLGTGIGVAAMLNNSLLRSRLGHAGSIGGHIPVRLNGRKCVCGAIGCAEAEASTSVLPEICGAWPGFSRSLLAQEPVLDFAALFRCKDTGDEVASEVLSHCMAVWSALSVGLIHVYGPELLLLGGGVMKRGEDILNPIRAYVHQHSWKTSRGLTQIKACGLGADAALIGAEALFQEGHA
jgi:glucokinase